MHCVRGLRFWVGFRDMLIGPMATCLGRITLKHFREYGQGVESVALGSGRVLFVDRGDFSNFGPRSYGKKVPGVAEQWGMDILAGSTGRSRERNRAGRASILSRPSGWVRALRAERVLAERTRSGGACVPSRMVSIPDLCGSRDRFADHLDVDVCHILSMSYLLHRMLAVTGRTYSGDPCSSGRRDDVDPVIWRSWILFWCDSPADPSKPAFHRRNGPD